MYIKEELVYNKQTGELVGSTNLGAINQHLTEFEQSTLESDSATTATQTPQTCTVVGSHAQPPLAKTMPVMMVRGLLTNLQFPYAQFPCHNLAGDQMYDPLWEAVIHIENIGLKVSIHYIIATIVLQVLALTRDGASVNHQFI